MAANGRAVMPQYAGFHSEKLVNIVQARLSAVRQIRPRLASGSQKFAPRTHAVSAFIGDIWSLEEDVPDRDARIAQVPIVIEFQVYDPLFVPKHVGGHRLTIDEVFSGPTVIRNVR